jgi:hypothetical protein
MRGSGGWAVLEGAQPGEYPIIDLPSNHPLFSSQFVIKKVPQIASINYWAGSGGDTSERGEDSREAHARACSTSTATSWC